MTATDLLDLLEARKLIPEAAVRALRPQLEETSKPVSAISVLRLLTKKRFLTQQQAEELEEELLQPSSVEDVAEPIGFALLDDEPAPPAAPPPPQEKPKGRLSLGPSPSIRDAWNVVDEPAAKPAKPGPKGESSSPPHGPGNHHPPSAGSKDKRGQPPAASDDWLKAFDDLPTESSVGSSNEFLGPAESTKPAKLTRRARSAWESPWLLFPAGFAILLLVLVPVLQWVIQKEGSDQTLAKAIKSFESQAFTTAVTEFDAFAKEFPEDERLSQARVLRGLAEVMQFGEPNAGNFERILEKCAQTLPKIGQEKAFAENRSTLAPFLAKLQHKLVEQAMDQVDQVMAGRDFSAETVDKLLSVDKHLAQREQAFNWIREFTLASARPKDQLANTDELLAIVQGKLLAVRSLQSSLGQLTEHVQANRPREALEVREGLLIRHPELAEDDRVLAPLEKLAERLPAALVLVNEPRELEPLEGPADALEPIPFPSQPDGPKLTELKDQVILLQASGVLAALAASDGKLLWRQPVGTGDWQAQRFGNRVVAVGESQTTVLFLDAEKGTPRGQQQFTSPVISMVPQAGQLLVAEQSGALHWLSDQGSLVRTVTLPQSLAGGIAVDAKSKQVLVVGDGGYLYFLDHQTGKCSAALFAAHRLSSTHAAPLALSGRFVVPLDHHGNQSHLLTVYQGTGGAWKLGSRTLLPGSLDTPLVSVNNRLAVVSNTGAMTVYQLPSQAADPLAALCESLPPEPEAPRPRYGLLSQEILTVAGNEVVGLRVRTTTQRLDPVWLALKDQQILARPWQEGKYLFVAHAAKAGGELKATALSMPDGQVFWSTIIAAPMAGQPLSARGEDVLIPLADGTVWNVRGNAEPRLLFHAQAVELAKLSQQVAAVTRQGAVTLLTEKDQSWQTQTWSPQFAVAENGPWAPFNDGLLMVDDRARIQWLTVRGERRCLPFQMPLSPGTLPHWNALHPLDQSRFVATNGEALQLVMASTEPRPQLMAGASVPLQTPLRSQFAHDTRVLYGLAESGQLHLWAHQDLQELPNPLSEVTLREGPWSVGDHVLLRAEHEWICLADGQLAWRMSGAEYDYPPTRLSGELALFSAADGKLAVISMKTGAIQHQWDSRLALAASPVVWGKGLLLGTPRGDWYRVTLAKAGINI